MRELLNQNPEKILSCIIWGTDFFNRNGIICNKRHFPTIGNYISYPLDIILVEGGLNRFLTDAEFLNRFGVFNELEYISLKYLITTSMQKVNFSLNRADYRHVQFPFIPTFIQLINLSEKGCSQWTKILGKKNVSNNVRNFENKWEISLGAVQGVFFWDRCYRNVQSIFFNSKLKWFYYQIIRVASKLIESYATLKLLSARNVHSVIQGLKRSCISSGIARYQKISLMNACS